MITGSQPHYVMVIQLRQIPRLKAIANNKESVGKTRFVVKHRLLIGILYNPITGPTWPIVNSPVRTWQ